MKAFYLIFVVLTAVQAAIHLRTTTESHSADSNFYDVIVIGSGIGGTAAASTLAKAGKSVLILQANDYIGGRTKSIKVTLSNGNNYKFEEGANWIHGYAEQNPITKLSEQMGNVKVAETDIDLAEVYDTKGKSVDFQADAEQIKYKSMLNNTQYYPQKGSLSDAFKKLNAQELNNKYFMYAVANDVEFETSGTIDKLSAIGRDDTEIDETQMLILNGYQAFPEYLARNEHITVKLSHQVQSVASNGDNVTVTCSNGNSFSGQALIVAVPLGVLKANHINFTPALPRWKKNAISNIGFGNVCKVFINLNQNVTIDIESHFIGVVADDVNQRGLLTYFLNLKAVAGLQALMTFGLGPNAIQVEQMDQQQLKDKIADRLNAFLEDVQPEDFTISRSHWNGDQHTKGAYSYSSVQTTLLDWQNLAKPIFDENIYFCGQHTYSKFRGTVHGAYLSGIAAANDILNEVTSENWVEAGAAA